MVNTRFTAHGIRGVSPAKRRDLQPATLHEATTAHPSATSIQPQIQPAQTS